MEYLIILVFVIILYFYNRFYRVNRKFDAILDKLYKIIEESKQVKKDLQILNKDLFKKLNEQKKVTEIIYKRLVELKKGKV